MTGMEWFLTQGGNGCGRGGQLLSETGINYAIWRV